MLKKLISKNSGGGVRPSPIPGGHLSLAGDLVLNEAAYKLVAGEKWEIQYEADPTKPPLLVVCAASASDKGAFTVTRIGNSSNKVKIRSLFNECPEPNRYVGHYRATKIAHGIRLLKDNIQETK